MRRFYFSSTDIQLPKQKTPDFICWYQTKLLPSLLILSLRRMVIVTYDEDGTVPLDSGKQIDIIPAWKRLMEVIVEFENYQKFRAFTVMLSDYNSSLGHQRKVYVHASSNKRCMQYFLVATTLEEREAELNDYNLKGNWKKQIPITWTKKSATPKLMRWRNPLSFLLTPLSLPPYSFLLTPSSLLLSP